MMVPKAAEKLALTAGRPEFPAPFGRELLTMC